LLDKKSLTRRVHFLVFLCVSENEDTKELKGYVNERITENLKITNKDYTRYLKVMRVLLQEQIKITKKE